MVKIWNLKSPPFLQALHFITSFGSCITPLLVDLFVSHLSDSMDETNSKDLGTVNASGISSQYLTSEGHLFNGSRNGNFSLTDEEVVLYFSGLPVIFFPYLAAAVIMLCAGMVFTFVFFRNFLTLKKMGLSRVDSFLQKQQENDKRVRSKPILILLFIIVFIYGGLECTYGAWILTFVVKYLGESFQTAALITTAYWASLSGGRAISIILTKLIRQQHLILICFTVSFVTFLVPVLACKTSVVITWLATVFIGVPFAPIFGNLIAFSQIKLNARSQVTTMFSLVQYVGFMSLPALVGFLIGTYSPMCFLYISLAGSCCIFLLFIIVSCMSASL